jgi:hypothetical protein
MTTRDLAMTFYNEFVENGGDAVQACDQLSIHSFFFVHDIRNCVIHVTFDGPDLCCCHMQRLLSNKKSEVSLAYL